MPLINRGGQFQIQLIQPVLTDNRTGADLFQRDFREAVQAAIVRTNVGIDLRIFFQISAQTREMFRLSIQLNDIAIGQRNLGAAWETGSPAGLQHIRIIAGG